MYFFPNGYQRKKKTVRNQTFLWNSTEKKKTPDIIDPCLKINHFYPTQEENFFGRLIRRNVNNRCKAVVNKLFNGMESVQNIRAQEMRLSLHSISILISYTRAHYELSSNYLLLFVA